MRVAIHMGANHYTRIEMTRNPSNTVTQQAYNCHTCQRIKKTDSHTCDCHPAMIAPDTRCRNAANQQR